MEPDEEKYTEEGQRIKDTIFDCLYAANNSGAFACGQALKDAPNPGLYIEGVGSIRVPLEADDLEMVKEACRMVDKEEATASNEKGVVALSPSRGIWELPTECWYTGNPSWFDTLEKVKRATCAELGMENDLKLCSSSLILQEEGTILNLSNRQVYSFLCRRDSNIYPAL